MKVILVGSGKTLFFLTRSFAAKGFSVSIINSQKGECQKMARQLKATIIFGNGSDIRVLQDAGAMQANALFAISPNDQDNLVICQLAANTFGIPKVIALANDPDNAEVFQKLGVFAFSTTEIVASLIEQRAALEQIVNLQPVAEGKVNVTEILLEDGIEILGKALQEVPLPKNALVGVIVRNQKAIVPRGSSELKAGDKIILITLPENHAETIRLFTPASF